MADDVIIKIDNVSKDFNLPSEKLTSLKSRAIHPFKKIHYKKQHALKNINLEIKKGEFFGIVGRNGSGKSTLLKLLAGIYQPTKGQISVRGKLVPFIELGVGFNPELSGRENVFLNGALLGFSEKEVAQMYDDIVEFAELGEFMEQKLKNYSSGMQVRLAFSMAIRAKADILLIDEVLAVGDADFQRKCYDYFFKMKKNKATVVFVSHDMNAINQFCDRAVLIDQSVIKDIGDTKKISEKYNNLFIESHKAEKGLNTLNKTVRKGSGAVIIQEASLTKETFSSKDSEIKLVVKLKAQESNHDLMTGFAIKNAQGLFINSCHTWSLEKDLALKPGEICNIVWSIPNVYEDGLHTIDVYAYGKNHEVYDVIDDAISFRVKRAFKSGALITVPVGIEINGSKRQEIS